MFNLEQVKDAVCVCMWNSSSATRSRLMFAVCEWLARKVDYISSVSVNVISLSLRIVYYFVSEMCLCMLWRSLFWQICEKDLLLQLLLCWRWRCDSCLWRPQQYLCLVNWSVNGEGWINASEHCLCIISICQQLFGFELSIICTFGDQINWDTMVHTLFRSAKT